MKSSRLLFLAVSGTALAAYLLTLAPSITWQNFGADSGDFATAVAVGGVPHPPGYPTYLLLGGLFAQLPLGDVVYRLNLFSAVCAAAAAGLAALAISHTLTAAAAVPRRAAGFCAATAGLSLAFAGLVWSQAVITEVYALNLLFAALLLWLALGVRPENQTRRGPLLAGLAGLSLGNHPAIVLFFPVVLAALPKKWAKRDIPRVLVAFGAGLLVYAILPLRAAASPPIHWGNAAEWPGFVWLVSAQAYHQFLFAASPAHIAIRTATELRTVTGAFLGWGLPVGLLGLARMWQLRRRLAVGSLLAFGLISAYAIGYNTADSFVYLLPALLLFAVWLGWGLADIAAVAQKYLGRRRVSAVRWAMLGLPLLALWFNAAAQNRSDDRAAIQFATGALHESAPHAVIVVEDDRHTFALWYAQYGLALRPDVAVVNPNLLAYPWYRRQLAAIHPRLVLLDGQGRPPATAAELAAANPGVPIYRAKESGLAPLAPSVAAR